MRSFAYAADVWPDPVYWSDDVMGALGCALKIPSHVVIYHTELGTEYGQQYFACVSIISAILSGALRLASGTPANYAGARWYSG